MTHHFPPMMPQPPSPSLAAPNIETREQLEVVLENIVQLQIGLDELRREQEKEISAIYQRYRVPLAEMRRCFDLETSWAEAWAQAHPEALDPDRSLRSSHAILGFRTMPIRIERASRRWTWSRIALTLAELAWGKRYLRVPSPEVDREALLADLDHLSPSDLRAAGIKVVQGECFYIDPQIQPETTTISDPAWQEAA